MHIKQANEYGQSMAIQFWFPRWKGTPTHQRQEKEVGSPTSLQHPKSQQNFRTLWDHVIKATGPTTPPLYLMLSASLALSGWYDGPFWNGHGLRWWRIGWYSNDWNHLLNKSAWHVFSIDLWLYSNLILMWVSFVGGFNPLWKILVKLDHLSSGRAVWNTT